MGKRLDIFVGERRQLNISTETYDILDEVSADLGGITKASFDKTINYLCSEWKLRNKKK